MNNASETPEPNPAHIPLYLVRDFVVWAALTAQGENRDTDCPLEDWPLRQH